MASNVTRDHHNLRRNLKLNGNYISNDGGDEGITVQDDGDVVVSDKLYLHTGGEYLESDGTDLTIASAGSTVLTNDQTTSTQYHTTIDKDFTSASTASSIGLGIDYDDTAATSLNQTTTNTALQINLNSASPTKIGSCNNYGIDLDVVGGTSGTQTSYGMDISCTGADTNYGMIVLSSHRQLQLQYDAGSGAKFTVADGSHLTIGTFVTETGNIILDASGDISLDAAGGDVTVLQADLKIPAAKKLYFDGGSDTYIVESTADTLGIIVGAVTPILLDANGSDGCSTIFKASCAGFTKIAEAFSDDSIIGSGGTHDTHIDFRFTNKISLAVTADITNLNLIFPAASGNFLLLLTYDGDWDITNWKVYESDESAADGDADVLWAGGSQPDTTASGVDIFSFFYDATTGSEKCYGVASLAFATP